MYAIITGASSGIGKELARELSKRNYDLILVARRMNLLEEIKEELKEHKNEIILVEKDLSVEDNIKEFYNEFKKYEIDILINNAGFGKIGFLNELKYEDGIRMIDTNVRALYALTHLFLDDVKSHILNVSSLAAFMPGPKMANYYASKAYVLSFSRAINYELKKQKSKLRVTTLCPGPVKTEFNKVAKGEFKVKGISVGKCVKKALNGMFRKKEIVYPSVSAKVTAFFTKLVPHKIVLKIAYKMQIRK